LLRGSEEALCGACHDEDLAPPKEKRRNARSQVTANQPEASSVTIFRHGPFSEGRCTPCHPAHEMNSTYLLRGNFPRRLYMPYSSSNYSSCFLASCHNAELTEQARTSSATGFRNGDDNLHYLHVAVGFERGRSCRFCHEPHQALNAALIRQGMPFGKQSLTLEFTATNDGGTCKTTCHEPLEYNRKDAILPARVHVRRSPERIMRPEVPSQD